MKKIYKYPLMIKDVFTIKAFTHFKPLSIQMQDGIITLWAEINIGKPDKEYKLYCYGTGVPIRDGLNYIGTVQYNEYVFHYYYD